MIDDNFKNSPWFDALPSKELGICTPYVNQFFETLFERQEIWHKRFILKKTAPWTENSLLRDYKFTNVYRCLDRSSDFLIKNVILKENDKINLVWKIILYRYFNNPDTFTVVNLPNYEDYDAVDFEREIDAYSAAGNNPFTTAYIINAAPCVGNKRHLCYCQKHIPLLHKLVPKIIKSMEESDQKRDVSILIKALNELMSVSDFLVHEFFQDFTYVKTFTGKSLISWTDADFTNVGPGCKLGLRLLFPSAQTPAEQLKMLYFLHEIADSFLVSIGEFKYINWDINKQEYFVSSSGKLLLHAIEMWCCEFQKYWKMTVGEGKQRSKFIPIS